MLPDGQTQPTDQLPVLDAVHVQRLPVVLLTGRGSRRAVALEFLDDGSQRYVGGQRVDARRGQLDHAAALGAFERQAEWPPDGIVGRHLEQVIQAALTEGVRARQDARVSEQRVAHRARQVLLEAVHGGD